MIQIWYHDNCMDGWCAAHLAMAALGIDTVTVIPVQYSEPPPPTQPEDEVYIVDFSYSRVILEQLKQSVTKLVVLDHHKTAEAELQGLDYCVFDQSKSGAVLTFEYFKDRLAHSQEGPYLHVLYVQDRDLWQWALPHSREVSAYFASHPKRDFWYWDKVFSGSLHDWRIGGESILRYQQQIVEGALKNTRLRKLGNVVVPVVNVPILQSEIGEALCKAFPDHPFAAMYSDDKEGNRLYSLRSRGDFDVAEFAKHFGGGGHKAAAGFKEDK